MMDRLRESVNGVAIKVILVLIILSFVLAGVSSYLVGGGSSSVAKVGSVEISQAQFEQAYQNERNRMQQQLGDNFSALMGNPDYVKSLRAQVLEQTVQGLLIEQYAEKLGLHVSDVQVKQSLLEIPAFLTDGKFDQAKYQATLRNAGYTPERFAESLRQDMLRNQILQATQGSDFILDNEVDLATKLFAQSRSIRTLTLDTAEFAKNVKVDDEAVKAYYQAHTDAYTRPEQYKVAYLEFSADKLKAQAQVSEQDAKDYYEQNLSKYGSASERKISHIFVKEDKAKAEAILAKLKAGEDFATLAKSESEDGGSAKQGGDLGWIEKGVMDKSFEDAAFALQNKGDYSDVVKSESGFHILQLTDVKDGDVTPFADVKDKILAQLKEEKALDDFYDLQEKLEKVAFESPDSLDEAAKVVDGKVVKTDFISMSDAPEVLQNPEVQQALESVEVKDDGLNSQAIDLGDEHLIIVRVDDVRDETVLPFEDVKTQATAAWQRAEGEKAALELAQKLIEGLNKGDQSVLEANNLSFSQAQTIDRSSPMARSIFALPKPQDGKTVYGETKDANGNTVIVALDKVSQMEQADQMKQQIAQGVQGQAIQQDQQAWIDQLRQIIDVKYYQVDTDSAQ
ncbi:MAG: peptidylprolyl isomerase [Vibrio sp.]